MIIKSFSHISRSAVLAKNLWTSSSSSSNRNAPSQPFFVSTGQLPRYKSQVTTISGNSNSFGENEDKSTHYSSAAGCMLSGSNFSAALPLASIDDDKKREIIADLALHGSQGKYMIYNHQKSLSRPLNTKISTRRYSIASRSRRGSLVNDNVRKRSASTSAKDHFGPSKTLSESNGKVPDSSISHRQSLETKVSPRQLLETNETHSQVVSPEVNNGFVVEGKEKIAEGAEIKEKTAKLKTASEEPAEAEVVMTSETECFSSFPDEYEHHLNEVTSKISEFAESGDHTAVLDTFDSLRVQGLRPTLNIYNHTLNSIAVLCKPGNDSLEYDVTPLLDVYSDMLKNKVSPNVNTYTLILSNLLQAADFRQAAAQSLLFKGVKSRHNNRLLTTIGDQLDRLDQSDSYMTLALKIFDASNSITRQKYSSDFYLQFLLACINHSKSDKLPDLLRISGWTKEKESALLHINLIRGFGKNQDLKMALKSFESFKQSVPANDKLEYSAYSALVGAYFDSSKELEAVKFFEKVLSNEVERPQALLSESFEKVLSSVILGFANIGDYESSWRWIQKTDGDKTIATISMGALASVFKAVCVAGDTALAESMFNFMAARKDIGLEVFNEVRCDYIMLCIENNDTPGVLKCVRESQLRSGIWDHSTVVSVVEYLIKVGNVDMAMNVFQSQASRLVKYIKSKNLQNVSSMQGFGDEAVNNVVQALKTSNNLGLRQALQVASSDFMNPRLFSSGSGTDIMETIWNARSKQDLFFKELQIASKLVTLDIVSLHNIWIRSAAVNNSLGQLSISTPWLSKIKANYKLFINDIVSMKLNIAEEFSSEVRQCLTLLEDNETLTMWNEFMASSKVLGNQSSQVFTPLNFNVEVSNKVIGYAQTASGIHTAFEMLQDACIRKELLTPEAFLTVIEQAGSHRILPIIALTYERALEMIPHPSSSPQAWDIWVAIHRAVTHHAADLDYKLAQTAYVCLRDIGSCPDATGYGQLIANEPLSMSRDEATDAIKMFNEAMSMNLVPNTFLYNVLLSKLSKARRLKEAIIYFNDMDRTQTKKSSVTYGTMISACCRAGDEEFAKTLFDEMESSPFYVPRIAPFNIMLQYYVHSKRDRQAALTVYNRLRKLGINPSSHTYKLLIDTYSTIEPVDIESAENVLQTIVEDQNPITSQHYAALIFAKGVGKNDFEACRDFYNSLVFRKRVRPDKVIFQALLEAYVVNQKIRETGQVLQEMVKYNVEMNAYMANVLIRGWAPISLEKSIGLFDYILKSKMAEPSSYESIIRAVLYHGDVVSARNVLATMKTNSYPEPVVGRVEKLINTYSALKPAEEGATRSGIMAYHDDFVLLDSIFRQDAHRLSFGHEEDHNNNHHGNNIKNNSGSNENMKVM